MNARFAVAAPTKIPLPPGEGGRRPGEGFKWPGRQLVIALLLFIALPLARGQEAIPDISRSDLPRLLSEIKPQPGESPWREIPWLTSVTEARRRANAEDKPIVIFTAADGSPLSRT